VVKDQQCPVKREMSNKADRQTGPLFQGLFLKDQKRKKLPVQKACWSMIIDKQADN
jgi:hypothetical protein